MDKKKVSEGLEKMMENINTALLQLKHDRFLKVIKALNNVCNESKYYSAHVEDLHKKKKLKPSISSSTGKKRILKRTKKRKLTRRARV